MQVEDANTGLNVRVKGLLNCCGKIHCPTVTDRQMHSLALGTPQLSQSCFCHCINARLHTVAKIPSVQDCGKDRVVICSVHFVRRGSFQGITIQKVGWCARPLLFLTHLTLAAMGTTMSGVHSVSQSSHIPPSPLPPSPFCTHLTLAAMGTTMSAMSGVVYRSP